VSLVFKRHYFDIAVRDVVMAIGAFALAKLSGIFNKSQPVNE